MDSSRRKIAFTLTLFSVLARPHLAIAADTCNSNGFLCVANNTFKLCIDGGPPAYESQCEDDTKCYMDCPIECSSESCYKCNKASYYCVNETHFQVCLEGSSKPVGAVESCPAETVCSMNCNSISTCTQKACPVTCTENTRLPVPNNDTSYYICSVDSSGGVTVTTHSCPNGTVYNDAIKRCSFPPMTTPTTTPSTTTPITTTPSTTTPTTTTTTPKPFECTAVGRFANPANCSKYYMCLAAKEGLYRKYEYSCPSGSYFQPTTTRCGLNSSICGNDKHVLEVPQLKLEVCLSDSGRFKDPTSCSHYFMCAWTDGVLTPNRYACPSTTVFNPVTTRCTGFENYLCNKG